MIIGKTPEIDRELLRGDLTRDEGVRREPYFDTEGFVTFGIGRNLTAKPLTTFERGYGKKFGFDSDEFINMLLQLDIDDTLTDMNAHIFPVIGDDHPEPVNRALTNMCFQMGAKGLLLFFDGRGENDALQSLIAYDYPMAAKKMGESKWARVQTPQRATRVLNLIATATFPKTDQ